MAIESAKSGSDTGADLLEALAKAQSTRGGLLVSQLATVTGRDRSLVRRVISDLLALGLVEYQPGTRRLRLGWKLYVTAAQVTQTRLATWSQPILDRLAADSREAAYVVIRRGADAVTVSEATPPMAVQVLSWVGRSFPVARSDAGPVLLGDLSPSELHELLDRRLPPTAARRAPRTVRGLMRLIETARRSGISILDEQAEPGVSSVAAPIHDFTGRLVAALVVSGPADRVRPRLQLLAGGVLAAAQAISDALGAAGGDPAVARKQAAG